MRYRRGTPAITRLRWRYQLIPVYIVIKNAVEVRKIARYNWVAIRLHMKRHSDTDEPLPKRVCSDDSPETQNTPPDGEIPEDIEARSNAKIVGTLDMLPKVVYCALETDIGDDPLYMWWGNFLIDPVEFSQVVLKQLESIDCRIVENFDHELLLVNYLKTDAIIINKGPSPAVHSVAEVLEPPCRKQWLHLGLRADREKVMQVITNLFGIAKDVYMVVALNPMKLVQVAYRCAPEVTAAAAVSLAEEKPS